MLSGVSPPLAAVQNNLVGSYYVPIEVCDTVPLCTNSTITITIVPPGQPQFAGIASNSVGLPTTGGSALVISGANFVGPYNFSIQYSNDALKALNLTYSTNVRLRRFLFVSADLCAFVVTWVCAPAPCAVDSVVARCCCGGSSTLQNCTVNSNTNLTCYTVPGVGTVHVLNLYSNGVVVQTTAQGLQYVSYQGPTLTNLSTTATNVTSLATVGNETLTLVGTAALHCAIPEILSCLSTCK